MAILQPQVKTAVDTIIEIADREIAANQPSDALPAAIQAERAEVVAQYTVYRNLALAFYAAPAAP